MAKRGGSDGYVELPTRPQEPWRSADVGLADNRTRRLTIVECWNTVGDVGAAVRSSVRKVTEAEALAAARWGTERQPVGLAWVVRATARNRALLARYPEVFARSFSGSSRAWLMALTTASRSPIQPGLVWCDVNATRLFEWHRP